MKVLIVGSGGREHAIARKLKESPQVTQLYCCPSNAGINQIATSVPVKATDIDGVVKFATENHMDMVVVAPDDPLVLGMVDALEAAGIKTFGPRSEAAMIEGSKVFSKNLMKKYHIPTAAYEVFHDAKSALDYIKEKNEFPVVIKADGLALGKGVIIAQTLADAEDGIQSIMEDKIFGASGNQVVVEEFLTGPEVSVLAFTDSKTMAPMVSSMDHKRIGDGDTGPNTGGMGTIAPNPYYTPEMAERCMKEIFLPTMEAMNKEGRPFKGCLYFGLMLTPKGPYVIEYNCRFGDPETQVVLPLLKTDLYEIFDAIHEERLGELQVEWEDKAAACVIMASGGYPKKYETGKEITGLATVEQLPDITVFHAGTAGKDGRLVTAGGRVLGVTAVGDGLENALDKAYQAVERIHFDGAHFRKDIGRVKR
ncbi:phosphoribosylamine--glycine ligase [Zongyangia hominis]|uniref:Phosphoribosylamine--glycine ligase n=1 Tax=Zongyangia hominis TaxID=2763677 RepID=A0A926E9F5_9FIRM|nr:phosphoribosylamine--glycine ligase [Zongyangia hominis]MBC8569767.1 phosphoribosylamine--glycine ligase [Zongyangia hominis]